MNLVHRNMESNINTRVLELIIRNDAQVLGAGEKIELKQLLESDCIQREFYLGLMNDRGKLINHIIEVAGQGNVMSEEAEQKAMDRFIEIISKR